MARPQLAPGTRGKTSLRERNGTVQGRSKARTLGGELVLLTASGATEAEVEEALDRQLRAATVYSGDRLHENSTVSEAIDRWLHNRRAAVAIGKLRPQSYEQYILNARKVKAEIGAVLLREARPSLILPFIERLAMEAKPAHVDAAGNKVAGTLSMPRHAHAVLTGAFATAVAHEIITHNPLAGQIAPVRKKGEKRALSIDEFVSMRESIIAWGSNPRRRSDWQRLLDYLDVSMGTSMRIGEVLALRPLDVNLVEQDQEQEERQSTLYITGTIVEVKGQLVRQPEPKRERQERAIALPRQTEQVLRRRMAGLAPSDLIFGTRKGTPDGNADRLITAWRTSSEGEQWMKACGLTDDQTTFKLMRRSAASKTRDELGVEAAGALLGHTRVSTTEENYLPTPKVNPRTAKVLEAMWG